MKKISMIHFIFMLTVLCLPGKGLFPEEQAAAPLQHKKKVFIDEKEKYIYWPMSMPFWVRLTASPGKDAPSYLLQRIYSKSTAESEGYMKNGIKLELTGQQFIRWYNAVTDETIYLKFFADGEAPVTNETLKGAPLWTKGEQVFYGKRLTGTISAQDSISGVEQIYVSIDGNEFEPYSGEIVFDKEKDWHLRFYAVDRVGYAGEPETVRFTVDLTPPQTHYQVHNNFSGDVLSTVTTIQLTAADNISGLKIIFYHLDRQADPSVYRGDEISLKELTDGEHRLTYYSLDNVQNLEDKMTYDFYLDRTPPEAGSSFVGDHHHESSVDYISPRTQIKLSAEDNKIGVERIEYALQKDQYITYFQPFSTSFKSGEHVITYRAIDRLGNMSIETKLPVRMDDTPPQSTCAIVGAKYQQRDTTWITRDTSIRLSAADDAAGVMGIYFQLGEKAEYKLYSQPISIIEEGRYLFKFYSADHVENRESEQPYIFIVDNTPPTVMKTFSVPSTGTVPDDRGNEIDVYPRFTSIFFGAMDNSAGIAGIWYTLNDAKEQVYTTPLMFKDEGDFSMVIRLQDNVGNGSSETLRFVIKD